MTHWPETVPVLTAENMRKSILTHGDCRYLHEWMLYYFRDSVRHEVNQFFLKECIARGCTPVESGDYGEHKLPSDEAADIWNTVMDRDLVYFRNGNIFERRTKVAAPRLFECVTTDYCSRQFEAYFARDRRRFGVELGGRRIIRCEAHDISWVATLSSHGWSMECRPNERFDDLYTEFRYIDEYPSLMRDTSMEKEFNVFVRAAEH